VTASRVQLTPMQTARGVASLGGVFSSRAGSVAALECARNIATAVLGNLTTGDTTPVADVIVEVLVDRRMSWPDRWEGALTDREIAELAARGGAAWAQATRAARAA
jgi:hypothetical protein